MIRYSHMGQDNFWKSKKWVGPSNKIRYYIIIIYLWIVKVKKIECWISHKPNVRSEDLVWEYSQKRSIHFWHNNPTYIPFSFLHPIQYGTLSSNREKGEKINQYKFTRTCIIQAMFAREERNREEMRREKERQVEIGEK